MAENPTSSSTAYTTFGAPSGAVGGSNGDQSGTESRISTLTLPLNGSLITHSSFEIGCHDQDVQRRTRPAVVSTLLQTAAPAHHPHRTIVLTSAGEPAQSRDRTGLDRAAAACVAGAGSALFLTPAAALAV